MRGEWTSLNQVLESLRPCWGGLIAASIITKLLVGLGLIFFILPGIYLAISWTFTYLVLIDQKTGFMTAMEQSRKAVRPNFWMVLLLSIALGLLMGIGTMITRYSQFVLMPFVGLVMTSAYEVCRRHLPRSGQ
jgi:uncharacterized membrane protein